MHPEELYECIDVKSFSVEVHRVDLRMMMASVAGELYHSHTRALTQRKHNLPNHADKIRDLASLSYYTPAHLSVDLHIHLLFVIVSSESGLA